MSYKFYLSCSRELNTGDYFLPPKAVYPSYAAFLDSEDYRLYERKNSAGKDYKTKPEFSFDPKKANGAVHVFESMRNSRCVSIYPFPSPSEWSEEEKFIASQFTQPYLYEISEFPADLLCKYLQADDRVEFLSVFLGHDNPLDTPVVSTLNLQDFVDGRMTYGDISGIISIPPSNNLTRILPPHAPQTQFQIEPVDFSNVLCTIYLNNADILWNWKALRSQGLL